ncbi:MAG: trypsin-like serine protease [Polyangia bacterium]|jgi:MYXO-CTERM domain-containing protein|nr:trypsin-like serine protease [Polyangia bacterium]
MCIGNGHNRTRSFPPFCLLAILLSLTGCQLEVEPSPQTIRLGRPIINGTADTSAAHMAVVALVPPQGSGYVGMHCTGTLITPTVVLTAGHCTEGYSVGGFDIFFGNNVWQSGTYRSVSEMQRHPDYGGQQNPVADIALVRLSSAAPSGVTPIPYLPSSLGLSSADEGGAVVFSGFGQTENDTSGVKMTVTGTIGKVCPGPSGCNYGGAWVVANAMGYPQTPGGPCSGDSGGPAFVTRGGQEYVAGVTSYGDEYCAQYGVSTMPQGYESWILSFTGGTQTEVCDNGLDDDNDGAADCSDPDCAGHASCQTPDACEAAATLSCGGQVSGTTVGGPTSFAVNSCLSNPEQGPERAYELAVAAGTAVTATLTPSGQGDLDLFLFAAQGAGCSPQSCLASSMNDGQNPESLQFTMPSGGAFLVVETWDTASPFTLQLSCQGSQQENCVNGVDDDGDGDIDCDDQDCVSTSACAPEAEDCMNGVDDDGDGATDCGDPDCASAENCQAPPPGLTQSGCSCEQTGTDGPPLPLTCALLLLGLAWRRRRATQLPGGSPSRAHQCSGRKPA